MRNNKQHTTKKLFSVWLHRRFTRQHLKHPNPLQQPARATSPPRRPPSCPLPQKTRTAVPYHQHHPQSTTRPATALCRQILMNGTCKYFQKTAELRLLGNQDSKTAYSRVDLHTHTMWRIFLKRLSRESIAWTECTKLLTAFSRFLSIPFLFPFLPIFSEDAQRTPIACYQQVTTCIFFPFLYIKIHLV